MEEFNEVNQKKFLAGLTVSRSYFYLCRSDVVTDNQDILEAGAVAPLEGVSKYKQAFGTGEALSLLVREKMCCCLSCLDRNFEDCELKTYVDFPKLTIFKPQRLDLWKQMNKRCSTVVSLADPVCERFVEKGSYYAVNVHDLNVEGGFVVVKCQSIRVDVITGMALLPEALDDAPKLIQLYVIHYHR